MLRLPACLAASLCCVSFIGLPARAAEPLSALPLPEMTVAKLPAAPKIDGRLEPGEWDGAAACTGFMTAFKNELSRIQSVAWVGYDDEYLYVAMKNLRGENYTFLKKHGREPDDEAIVFDTANEIWITPPVTPATTYQTLFNTYPGVLDVKMIPSVGYNAKSWNGRWQIAASETRDHWIIEARAPIKSFGFDSIQDGQQWRALFCTDVLGGAGFTAWAPGGGFGDISRHGHLRFRAVSPVFQILDVETIFTGKPSIPMAVTAPTKGRGSVEVAVRFGRSIQAGAGDLVLRKTVSVADGKREEFKLEADLAKLDLMKEKDSPAGYCEVKATADGNQALYHQVFPFVVDGSRRTPPASIVTTPYKTPFGMTASYAPLNKKLIVKIDRLYMPDRADVAGGTARLVDPKTGKVVAERPIAPFYFDYSQFPMDLAHVSVPVETEADWQRNKPVLEENQKIEKENQARAKRGEPPLALRPLPAGPAEFRIEVALAGKEGKELAKMQIPVSLKGYQFEWMPNSVGISDEVIPPWTPVKAQGDSVEMWNKRYQLDSLGLARQITNAGQRQLTGPMRMLAVVDGKETEVKAGPPSLVQNRNAYAEWQGTASVPATGKTAASLDIKTSSRVEFDGCVLNTMQLIPKGKPSLDRLSLVVTMPKAEAPCFVTTSGGWSSTFGWTPKRWDSRESSSGSLVGNFVPFVFLTDSDRGFCFFADNERGWLLDPEEPTIEVASDDKLVTLRVHFVNRPGQIERPTTIRYGWMVTPQKPQPAGWRTWRANFHRPFPELNSVFWGMDQINWAVLWPYYSSPFPWDYEKSKPAFDNATKNGIVLGAGNIAHAIARYMDYKGRWFNEVAADWGQVLGNLSNGNVALSRGPNDFRLWHWDRWIRLSGMNGLYFDETYLNEDRNYLTGGAYLLPDERIQPGYNFLGEREMCKRLRYLFHQHKLAGPRIWFHTTANHPVYAWLPDIAMEGENVEPTGGQNDYLEALPASRLRSIGMGRNLGAVPLIMGQADRHWDKNHSPHLIPQMVGWVLAHDCLPEQSGFWDVLCVENQMWRDEIVFRPYWKEGIGVASLVPDVVASAHTRPTSVLLWICNTSWQDREARVSLDLAKLGLNPSDGNRPIRVFDAETGEPYSLRSSTLQSRESRAPDSESRATLTIQVPKRFWRAVRLVQPRTLQPGQNFVARFESADAKADESLGYYAPYQWKAPAAEPPAGRAGKGASLDQPLTYLARHHVFHDRGKIAFQVQLDPRKSGGTLVRIDKLDIALAGGKLQVRAEKDTLATADLKLPEGKTWLAVEVRWQNQKLDIRLGDQTVPTIGLNGGMPLQKQGRGLEIRGTGSVRADVATIAFGPIRDAVLDDLVMGLP